MFVNLRTVALALFVAVAAVRAVDDTSTPAGNGTTSDAPAAGNGTTADAPTAPSNGTTADAPPTSNNGTSAEPPAAPQPSSGASGSNSRRALQACEWSCPWRGAGKQQLVEFDMEGAFTCKYADHVTCVYQKTTGVLTRNEGECPNAATALTAGCIPGQSTNGGLLNLVPRDRKTRRTSRDIQRSAMKRRNML